MSSAPTQLAVAPSASSMVTSTTQESTYPCQNSLPRARSGIKSKHLTRSHAMRESASPPRTPTPRSSAEGLASSPISFSGTTIAATHSHSSSSETLNENKVQVQSLSSSPLLTTSSPISTTQTQESGALPSFGIASNQQQQQQNLTAPAVTTTIMYSGTESNGVVCNQSQLDVDFPKLTPPKSSKAHRNHNNNNISRDSSEKQLNTSSDSSMSSSTTKQSSNYGGMSGNSDGKCGNKAGEDGMKANHHHNKNNRQSNGNQSPPNQKQAPSQRRNQAQQQMQDPQLNHQMQGDSNLVNNFNSLQISSPPPHQHQLCLDKETTTNNRYMRANDDNCSGSLVSSQMNCTNSSCNSSYGHDENRNNVLSASPTDNTNLIGTTNSKCDRQMGKKHRNNANAKGSKARLKNMGSSSSVEGGNSTSGFISRDSSSEQFTDSSGIDLKEFFRETLSKNPIDRHTLLDIEKDLTDLVHDKNRSDITYPAMSSYNRMLIHRVAAFFGMEHNVDSATPHCVVVSKTKQTRIPSIKFKSLYRGNDLQPRKSILKRDAYSFDEPRRNLLSCPDHRGMLDRKAKSYEQREEEYEQARKRIFRMNGGGEMNEWHSTQWCGNDSPEHSHRMRQNKLLKVQSMSSESRSDGRPSVSKSHSFGGYGGPPQGSGGPLTRGDSVNSTRSAGARLFPKQDSIGSTNTPWRLSPSSSGYKTQTQSLRSDSVTPSPTGYGSDDHTPEPCVVQSPPAIPFGVVWAVTDMASVPRGSVLINPHTLQPIVNQDGSVYRFDPSNLPPSQAVTSSTYSNNKSTGVISGHRKIIVDKTKVIKHDSHNGISNNTNTNPYTSNTNNINNTQDSTAINSNGAIATGQQPPIINHSNSVESLSESSAQTILIVENSSVNHDEESESNVTKESHPHREMSDIQEESSSQSIEDKQTLTMDILTDTQDKPKLINQATSPNIPSPEPEQAVQSNENTKSSSSSNSTVEANPSNSTSSAASTSSTTTVQQTLSKKDETSSKQSSATPNIPLMSFAPTGYQALDGSTVFASPTNAPFPAAAAYQTGLDGSVYAVPQPMVYAYPPPMDGEFQGYFMPVYDQSQRDPNGLVTAAPAHTIYQPAGGPATTVVAYPTGAPYGGAPIYQSQVVYSPADQFATASTGSQLQQYPVPTYPVSYTYPYNGYWGQPAMTYYVPQPTPPQIASSILSQTLSGASGNSNTNVGSSTSHSSNSNSSNSSSSTKRSTPPQNGGHHSQSITPATASTYQFAATAPPGLSIAALATAPADPNGPPGTTMYAIPQSAVFPGMLPYAPSPGTPSSVISHHLPTPGPHPQPNAVINPLISTQATSGLAGGLQMPLDTSSASGGGVIGGIGYTVNTAVTDRNGSHGGNASGGTPHSAPSTPLSNPVTITHQQRNPPPLFATPPILPNSFNNPMQSNYSNLAEVPNGCVSISYSSVSSSNYERKNPNKRNSNYSQNNRQNSYNNQNGRKSNSNDHSNNPAASPSTNQNGNNRPSIHMQQKRINSNDKNQSSINNSTGNTNSAQNNNSNTADKSRNSSTNIGGGSANTNGGIRSKPSNLDLRRSASQRNSPSTNSIESNNNSPNSIASMNHMMAMGANHSLDHPPPFYMTRGTHIPPTYMTRGTHIPPMHPSSAAVVAAATDPCHPQLIGAAYNHPGAATDAAPAGMYIKYGQTYYAHPSMALPNNRRSPPNDMRPQLTPLPGVYPALNMMLPAPRTMPPRQPNPNYKGNKPSR